MSWHTQRGELLVFLDGLISEVILFGIDGLGSDSLLVYLDSGIPGFGSDG